MRGISIRQPWAWLITHGHKPVENRTWETFYRGSILIHAGKIMTRADYEAACIFIESDDRIRHVIDLMPKPQDLERGGIVGQCELVGCVRSHPSPFFVGPFGFVMDNPRPLPFVARGGMLGIFTVML